VNHVRDIFLDLQDSAIEHIPYPIQYSWSNFVVAKKRSQDLN
jgi:hypothetical protein